MRYIDADALMEMLSKKAQTDLEMGLYNHGTLTQSFIRFVERQPTADVAPRADFEALKDEADRYKRYFYRHDYDEMIAEAKAEVAREIFEKIEKHLFVIAPIEEFDGWARIQLADIMRLKNKYTEAEPPEGD